MKDKNMQTPEEHRMEQELRVCDPARTDRTAPITPQRVQWMADELKEGFDTLHKYRLAATFFGSSRCSIGDDIYNQAMELSAHLSRSGFTIVTGGGGGVMEAANRGAFEAGGQSVGLNIKLPHEQSLNAYTTENKEFNYFFTRKVMLTFASEVYIYFPGGFGTMDELFEILTLIQTRKIKRLPIILYNKEYWEPIVALMEKHFYEKYQSIDKEDLSLFTVVDSVEEAHKTVLDLVKC